MMPFASTVAFKLITVPLGLTLILWWLWRIARFLQRNAQRQKYLVDRINRVLPQTQCGECGHAGCRPYARAISRGEAINKCPPGGNRVIVELAALTNSLVEPLDPAHGIHKPGTVAVIREDECIGCTKCIRACPVDAILGGPKLMHTVISEECTGCDLCVEPCPVDCIDMMPLPSPAPLRWQLPQHVNSDLRLLETEQ